LTPCGFEAVQLKVAELARCCNRTITVKNDCKIIFSVISIYIITSITTRKTGVAFARYFLRAD